MNLGKELKSLIGVSVKSIKDNGIYFENGLVLDVHPYETYLSGGIKENKFILKFSDGSYYQGIMLNSCNNNKSVQTHRSKRFAKVFKSTEDEEYKEVMNMIETGFISIEDYEIISIVK